MIPVFLSTKANASTASALVFENVKALRSTAAPEWQSVLEHVAYPEGEWVQVVLAPAAVWVYVLKEQKASYGMDALMGWMPCIAAMKPCEWRDTGWSVCAGLTKSRP
ncbi:MAG: hypothetical protein LW729_04865 [Bacteroidetes bacterium]|nr:hypothetical protein [Bacteroidota bacterium]